MAKQVNVSSNFFHNLVAMLFCDAELFLNTGNESL